MRAKIMHQRIKIIQHASTKLQRTQHRSRGHWISTKCITKAVKKFLLHHQQFSQSLKNVTSLYTEIDNERVSNIQAIESASGKRIYDSHTKYQTFVLEKQGKQAHNDYIQSIKHRIFGDRYLQTNRPNDTVKGLSGYARLTHIIAPWQEVFYELEHDIKDHPFSVWLQEVHRIFSKAKRLLRDITKTILQTRRSEWQNAKIHYIRVGKHGKIARMINLKPRSGPTASKMYRTKPGEAIKPAISIEECKEATILMHTSWMANPPGVQNCHFLDIISDNTGHCGVKVNSRKQFDIKAQWQYLEGMLEERVDAQTADRIKEVHQRLPKLFGQIKTDTVLNYPF
jgi:hypothetical protein